MTRERASGNDTSAILPERGGVLELRKISKAFANVQALSDVSMDVNPGEILAVMGENGAGKSTLLRILNGDYQPDIGTLRMDGEQLAFANPWEAHGRGIRVVYQEPEILLDLDVAENIWVGDLPRKRGVIDRRSLLATVRADLAHAGFAETLPIDLLGRQLSPAQRQIVEIMRALRSNARVLAFDEPTSSLTDNDVDRLFTLIRRLRTEGWAIVYVSHRINEILELADRVVVLRDGKLVADQPVAELAEHDIVRLMVGRDLSDVFKRHRVATDQVVLKVEDLHSQWHDGVSFEVHAGEVVGFAGLVGAGRTELARVLFGADRAESGVVWIDNQRIESRSPEQAISHGIGLVPEDRKREGLILQRSVLENITMTILSKLTRFGFVRSRKERQVSSEYVERLNVRTPSLDQLVGKLSGGNQQKVVLARWLLAKPKVLILDEPTRGIDVGAKAEIYELIDELATQGVGIILISSELPEVLGLSDRIYVMQSGSIMGEMPGPESTEEKVLALAMAKDSGSSTQYAPSTVSATLGSTTRGLET